MMSKLYPFFTLVAASLIPISGALFFNWSLFDVVFSYWLENVIIGSYNFFAIKLAALPMPPTRDGSASKWTKQSLLPFYVAHYGIFTIVHLGFITELFGEGEDLNFLNILFSATSFIIGHGYAFWRHNLQEKAYLYIDPMSQMSVPYVRIIAAHLVVLFVGLAIQDVDYSVSTVVGVIAFFKVMNEIFVHRRNKKRQLETKD